MNFEEAITQYHTDRVMGKFDGLSGPKIERGALDELRETASKALACVTEIRGSAAVTADRLIGECPEKISEGNCQPDPYGGKIGSLYSVIQSLVREAEAALDEVRRFNKL